MSLTRTLGAGQDRRPTESGTIEISAYNSSESGQLTLAFGPREIVGRHAGEVALGIMAKRFDGVVMTSTSADGVTTVLLQYGDVPPMVAPEFA